MSPKAKIREKKCWTPKNESHKPMVMVKGNPKESAAPSKIEEIQLEMTIGSN